MEVTLKPARDEDAERLLGFVRAYYEFDRLPFNHPEAAATLHRLIEDRSLGRAWVIEADAEPVGYVILTLGYSLEYGGRDAFVDELYLDASSRGRGIGRRVLALVEQEARSLGVRALHLEVERGNHAAQAFYRSAGYEDHDRYLMTKGIP